MFSGVAALQMQAAGGQGQQRIERVPSLSAGLQLDGLTVLTPGGHRTLCRVGSLLPSRMSFFPLKRELCALIGWQDCIQLQQGWQGHAVAIHDMLCTSMSKIACMIVCTPCGPASV